MALLKKIYKHLRCWRPFGQPATTKIALVCIAKNEDHYLQEWIDYNRKLGFDAIYIYQNNWRTTVEGDNIIKIEMDGQSRQLAAYNHFIKRYAKRYDWAAFFDVDEFLVLKKQANIKDFLWPYRYQPAIGINWVLFGDNFQPNVVHNNYSVLKRFTRRQRGVDPHIKSIVNTRRNPSVYMEVHAPWNMEVSDTNKKMLSGAYHSSGDDTIAQLNHYFCKTREEFIEKVKRGRADVDEMRKMEQFEEHNFNETDDFTARNFLYGEQG